VVFYSPLLDENEQFNQNSRKEEFLWVGKEIEEELSKNNGKENMVYLF